MTLNDEAANFCLFLPLVNNIGTRATTFFGVARRWHNGTFLLISALGEPSAYPIYYYHPQLMNVADVLPVLRIIRMPVALV